MKHNKLVSVIILACGSVALSACSLFNDKDIEIKNSYNPHDQTPEPDPNAIEINGIPGTAMDNIQSYCFQDLGYAEGGTIVNHYKENAYNVNGGNDYDGNSSTNNYDLYVPMNIDKTKKNTVLLFIHGGSWIMGVKEDVNEYVQEFARRGYVTATIKYTLLRRSMDDSSRSIFRNLDEIHACIASIKSVLGQLDFDTTKLDLAIGGASSGAHLSMLYSYSRGDTSPIPIKFVVDAVGPVNIKSDTWKEFKTVNASVLDAGLTYSAISAQASADNLQNLKIAGESGENPYWNEYHTMRIANGMCGMPYSLDVVRAATDEHEATITDPSNAAYVSMTAAGGGEDQLSVTYWINHTTNRFPIICGYAGKDTIVGIAQYAKLEKALDDNSITHPDYFYFRNCNHTDIKKGVDNYDEFVNQIDAWCAADSI